MVTASIRRKDLKTSQHWLININTNTWSPGANFSEMTQMAVCVPYCTRTKRVLSARTATVDTIFYKANDDKKALSLHCKYTHDICAIIGWRYYFFQIFAGFKQEVIQHKIQYNNSLSRTAGNLIYYILIMYYSLAANKHVLSTYRSEKWTWLVRMSHRGFLWSTYTWLLQSDVLRAPQMFSKSASAYAMHWL